MLWSPEAHEPLSDDRWDDDGARAAIRAIVADAESAFADGWPAHADDAEPNDPGPWRGLYLGGAGVVDALRRLSERGHVELGRDYVPTSMGSSLTHLDRGSSSVRPAYSSCASGSLRRLRLSTASVSWSPQTSTTSGV